MMDEEEEAIFRSKVIGLTDLIWPLLKSIQFPVNWKQKRFTDDFLITPIFISF